MSPPLIALPACLPSELLSYLIQLQIRPTTLLICSSRQSFLTSLGSDMRPQQESSDSSHDEHADKQAQDSSILGVHPLLKSTLHQISISRHLQTVFTPTISHLRAYLSVFSDNSISSTTLPPSDYDFSYEKASTDEPLLVIYGLVDLHRDTSEWSVQGLGMTAAEAVEAGRRVGRKVLLIEPHQPPLNQTVRQEGSDDVAETGDTTGDQAHEEDLENQEEMSSRIKLRGTAWNERLPMLNKSVKRQGDGDENYGDTWMGRTIEVGAVLGRWFMFAVESFWEDKGYIA